MADQVRQSFRSIHDPHAYQSIVCPSHCTNRTLGQPCEAGSAWSDVGLSRTATVSLIRGALHLSQKQQESTAAIFVVVLCSFESTVFASGEKKGVQTFDSIIRRFWVWSPNQAGSDFPYCYGRSPPPNSYANEEKPERAAILVLLLRGRKTGSFLVRVFRGDFPAGRSGER